MKRNIIYSNEYIDFVKCSSKRAQDKLRYATSILENIKIISSKFVKKLVGTDFYELRISVDNEIRVILFAVDHENINDARIVIFLNGFVKKDTKEYKKEIDRAISILKRALY